MKYFSISLIALLFVASCGHHHHHDIHDEATSAVYLDANTIDYELFADATPLTKGNTSEFTVHITRLSDFKPLKKGGLKVWWLSNESQQLVADGLELTDGIVSFEFRPDKSGKGVLKIEVLSEELSGTTEHLLEVFETSEQAINAAKSAEPDPTNAVAFTRQQAWKIDFMTAHPQSDNFGTVVRTAALVEASPRQTTMLSAGISGMVSFADPYPNIGVKFDKGQAIMRISGDQLVANNLRIQFEEARLNLEKAETDYQRALKLAADQIVSEKELQQLRLQYEQAKKQFDNLKRNAANGQQLIQSPTTSYIQQLLVQNGQYVDAGSPLVIVSTAKRMQLTAGISTKYLPYIGTQLTGIVISSDKQHRIELGEINAKVTGIGQSLTAGSALLPLNIEVDAAPGLIPGSLANVLLRFPSQESVLVVPNESIIEEQGLYFVFVQLHPELFEKREIKKGESDGMVTAVLSGIEASEKVVTRGAITIKLAQSTGELDPHAGHNH